MAKTQADYQALLDKVDDAIEAVLEKGESITFDGVTYTKANIRDLMTLQAHYEKKVNRLEKGDRRVAEF